MQSESKYPAISVDKIGTMLIAREDNRPRRALYTIFYQVIDNKINFLGLNKPVTSSPTQPQLGASVVATDNNVGTVVWHDKRNGNYDIYGQLIDLLEGALIGQNFPVNGTDTNDEIYAAVDRDGVDTYHSVTWMDNRNPEGIWDIFFRSLDKDGQPLTGEIEVSKLFGVEALYDDDENYDDPGTPSWNEDPRTDAVYTYESAKAVVDMMQENNIDNLWQITELETLPHRGKATLDDYDVVAIDLGWRHGGTKAGSMTPTERNDLTSYITSGKPALIMGNDFGYQYSGDPLYAKFYINYVADGNPWTTGNIKTLYGKDDRFTKGMQFSFRFQDTCDNYVDRTDVAGADTIFYSDGPSKTLYMRGSAYCFAWKADGNTSHLTFSLDGLISDEHPNTNIELVRRMMAFLGQRVAPEPVTTLRDSTKTEGEGTVRLWWTAPLNQKVVSPDAASGYILKFTFFENIPPDYGKMTTDAEFDAGNTYYQEWVPLTGGNYEDKTLDGLPPGDTLIFAIKPYDNYKDTLRTATLGDEPKVVVPGDTVTPHTIVVGQSGGYVKDFIVSEMMDIRTGTTGGSDTLFFTWDASNLYIGYARNNWSAPGGDMLVYLDIESGGADSTFPLNSGKRNKLPYDFQGDYCFIVYDYASRRLFQNNGLGDWDKTALPYNGSFSEDDTVNSREYTEFSIPFSDLGYNPSNPFNFLVTCQNETDNNLWNAFPVENPIAKTTTLTHYYHFDMLGPGVSPREAGSSLNIELSEFTAVCKINGIEIKWRTESQNDIYQWILEKKESNSFYEIGRLNTVGNSQSSNEYTFIDEDVTYGHTYKYKLQFLSNSGKKISLGIITVQFLPSYPKIPYLYPISPNPLQSKSNISFSVPVETFVSLKIYDIAGRLLETLVYERKTPGIHTINCSFNRYVQGVYFIEFQCDSERMIRKITLLR